MMFKNPEAGTTCDSNSICCADGWMAELSATNTAGDDWTNISIEAGSEYDRKGTSMLEFTEEDTNG